MLSSILALFDFDTSITFDFLVLYDTIENTPKKQKTLKSFANKLVEAVFDDQRQQDHLFSVERYSC